MKEKNKRNNHFISEALTRPWEVEEKSNSQVKKYLYFFDLESQEIKRRSPRYTLSANGIFTDEVEDFLAHRIENPFFQEVIPGLKDPANLLNSAFDNNNKSWIALYNYYFTLPLRVAKVKNTDDSDIDDFVRRAKDDDRYLEKMTMAWYESFDFVCFSLPKDLYYFFPSNGFFALPLGLEHAIVSPVNTQTAICFYPRWLQKLYGYKELLKSQISKTAALSVGLASSFTHKVIIPPEIYGQYSKNTNNIISYIVSMRDAAEELSKHTQEIQDAFQINGIIPFIKNSK